MQARIVAKPHVRTQGIGKPIVKLLLGDVNHLDAAARGLTGALQRIAAVDEQGGALCQHHRRAGRAAEARDPGQALGARRHVFALVLVGARHDEAVKAAPRQFFAQQGKMRAVALCHHSPPLMPLA